MKEYSIGQMSRRTGVKVTTIRYYESRGLIPSPARTTGGQRRYDEAALERLGMTPLADFEFNTGGGMGSVAAIGLLRTACAPFLAAPAAK